MTGMQIVPSVATEDMVERGREQLSQGDAKVQTHARVLWVWEAMLAAAPALTDEQIDAMCLKMRRAFNVAPHDQDRRMMRAFLRAIQEPQP